MIAPAHTRTNANTHTGAGTGCTGTAAGIPTPTPDCGVHARCPGGHAQVRGVPVVLGRQHLPVPERPPPVREVPREGGQPRCLHLPYMQVCVLSLSLSPSLSLSLSPPTLESMEMISGTCGSPNIALPPTLSPLHLHLPLLVSISPLSLSLSLCVSLSVSVRF